MSPLRIVFCVSVVVCLTSLGYYRVVAFRAWAANDLHWFSGPRGWKAGVRRWQVTPPKARVAFVVGFLFAIVNIVLTTVFQAHL